MYRILSLMCPSKIQPISPVAQWRLIRICPAVYKQPVAGHLVALEPAQYLYPTQWKMSSEQEHFLRNAFRFCWPSRYHGRRQVKTVQQLLVSLEWYFRLQSAPDGLHFLLVSSPCERGARQWWLFPSEATTFP